MTTDYISLREAIDLFEANKLKYLEHFDGVLRDKLDHYINNGDLNLYGKKMLLSGIIDNTLMPIKFHKSTVNTYLPHTGTLENNVIDTINNILLKETYTEDIFDKYVDICLERKQLMDLIDKLFNKEKENNEN